MLTDLESRQVDTVLKQSDDAFQKYCIATGATKAIFLEVIATEIEALGDTLVHEAMRETNLPEARLAGSVENREVDRRRRHHAKDEPGRAGQLGQIQPRHRRPAVSLLPEGVRNRGRVEGEVGPVLRPERRAAETGPEVVAITPESRGTAVPRLSLLPPHQIGPERPVHRFVGAEQLVVDPQFLHHPPQVGSVRLEVPQHFVELSKPLEK